MHIEARQGMVFLKLDGHFTVRDAERVSEAVEALAPFSQLIVDFTEVREFHDAAFFSFSRVLRGLAKVNVVLRGLTRHQTRVLRYLGLPLAEVTASA